jgi:hypothetical protein
VENERGYYRWLARSMRTTVAMILLGLAVVTVINWRSGVPTAPFWFYACMVALCGLFWLFASLILAMTDRKK